MSCGLATDSAWTPERARLTWLVPSVGNDAAVRRLLTAEVNPELRTVAAMAAALGAEVRIVPRRKRKRQPAEKREEPV